MALYHMIGFTSSVRLYSLRRYAVRKCRDHVSLLVTTWHRRSRPFLLSSSLIVLRKQDDPIITARNRSLIVLQCNYAELSPCDTEDDSFLTSLRTTTRPAMKFLEELTNSLPSSSDFEQAKAKLSLQLSELSQRLSDTTTDDIKETLADKASEEAALLNQAVAEGATLTKKVINDLSDRMLKEPTPPGTPVARFNNTHDPVQSKRDLALPQDIIDQNKIEQQDTELLPRFQTAVRQFKDEIIREADQSGDPPISLVSRKAKERIENFIQAKKKQFSLRGNRTNVETDSAPLQRRPPPSIPSIPEDKEESIMDYIISNVPGLRSETVPDPELEDIMSMQKGTYYNDSFLVDTIDIEDEVLLISQGWTKEISKPNLNIWKKHLEEEGLSLYKIFGKINDISALEMYNAQVNDEHRMVWDASVQSLHVLDVIDNNTEIMYWAVKFPFPLTNRDYVFERIHMMDEARCRLEITSRSVTHRSKPESSKYARVLRYGSRMVMIGDHKLDTKGMSYVLTYYDDFRAPIPSHWMDRFANEKIPAFLDSVHDAAIFLGKNGTLYLPYAEKKKKR